MSAARLRTRLGDNERLGESERLVNHRLDPVEFKTVIRLQRKVHRRAAIVPEHIDRELADPSTSAYST
jgi:hypothetical protein